MFNLFVCLSSCNIDVSFVKKPYPVSVANNFIFSNNILTLFYPCESKSICSDYKLFLPRGRYKFETWGADGGDYENNAGGKGGYSCAEIALNARTCLYVSIGGKGEFDENYTIQKGGYNGGGDGIKDSKASYVGVGGGGATDIRISSNTLYNRVMVSGGGGGSGKDKLSTGCGGGIQGGSVATNSYNIQRYSCVMSGANQTSPGISQSAGIPGGLAIEASFGYGGSFTNEIPGWHSGGGGGGWYGGARGCVFSKSGSGGSGFIFTKDSIVPEGYKLSSKYQMENGYLLSGCANGIPEINRSGNGAARITFLGNNYLFAYVETCSYQKRNRVSFVFIYIIIVIS